MGAGGAIGADIANTALVSSVCSRHITQLGEQLVVAQRRAAVAATPAIRIEVTVTWQTDKLFHTLNNT